MKITAQQLTAVNLRYSTTARSLKTMAFADLASKALLLLETPQTVERVSQKIAELISVRSVSYEFAERGLKELKNDRKAEVSNNKWKLCDTTCNEIKKEVSSTFMTVKGILDRHFPRNIEANKLFDWFNDAIADFFIYNGDEWVQSVCKGTQNFSKNVKTSDEILASSIRRHRLEKCTSELKNSFRGFLASNDLEDQRYLTKVGFAMFSARLVAADVGADPITLDELRSATFLLDTNFLFALQLESSRLADSLEILGRAMQAIGAKLAYLNETRDEYGRVWAGKRAEILRLLEIYPSQVVVGTDDDFISAAIARKCVNKEDFELFFQSLCDLPRQTPEGPEITLLDDEEILKETERAKDDNNLKNAIQKWCLRLRPIWHRQPKSNSALGHDASLIYVVELEKKSGNKIFILTLDRSLQACCAERGGRHEVPPAIYLEGLIQILAANNAGPDLDATNFAPLLISILHKRCVPPEHMYSTQDLHWLYGIQRNVASFKPEKIKKIALEVTKARLAGKTANDEKLQLTVNRLYQEEIQNTKRLVQESIDRARKAEEELEREKSKSIDLAKKLLDKENKEKLQKAKRKLIGVLSLRIPASIILALGAYFIVSLTLSGLQKENILNFIISFCTLVGSGYKFVKSPIKKYIEFKKSLGQEPLVS